MKRVRARASASIANLGYGFDVFAMCVGIASDEVELSLGVPRTTLVVERDEAQPVPHTPAKNTAGVALQSLMRAHKIRVPVRIRLVKQVPSGGLGSSAASAAAAVTAGNRLFRLGLTPNELVRHAAAGEAASAGVAHADNVAASLLGGFVVVDREDFSRILRLVPGPGLAFAVATPRVRVTTAEARKTLPRHVTLATYSEGCARAGAIAAAIARGDVAALGRAVEGSFVDRARAHLIPGYDAVAAAAHAAGAAGVTVSGAGPSVAAIVDARAASPLAVAAAMRAAFANAGVESEARVGRPGAGARVIEAR